MSKRCVGLAILTSQILCIPGAADRDIGQKFAGQRPTDPFVAARRGSATYAWVGRFRELLDERGGDLLVRRDQILAQLLGLPGMSSSLLDNGGPSGAFSRVPSHLLVVGDDSEVRRIKA